MKKKELETVKLELKMVKIATVPFSIPQVFTPAAQEVIT
jgi:hypothetical protein